MDSSSAPTPPEMGDGLVSPSSTAASSSSAAPIEQSHAVPSQPRALPPRPAKAAERRRARKRGSTRPVVIVPGSDSSKSISATGGGFRHPFQSLREVLFKDPTASVPISRPEDKIDRLLAMMRVLGLAMLDSHQATVDVQEAMYDIARAYNMPPVRVVTLPTVFAVQVEGTDRRVEIGAVEDGSLRLDQAAAIDLIVERAKRGVIEPDEAIARVQAARESKERFNPLMRLLGQILMTLAIGLLINPALPAIPAYVVLGLIVAILQMVGEKISTLAVAMPVLAAAVITIVAAGPLTDFTHEVPIRLIAPALVTFLPGSTLTIAALELTRHEVISGSTRLIYGVSQLLLLAFGVAIGLAIVGDAWTTNEVVINSIGPWTPLLGIALLALGYVLGRSAPEGSYLWLVLALALTYGAQRVGLLLVPPEYSGFFGALVVVPLSRFLAKFRTAPPATVTQLVSFWILVPGSLGFISFTEAAAGSTQTVTTLVTTGMTMFAIALGMIVGSGLMRDTRIFDDYRSKSAKSR